MSDEQIRFVEPDEQAYVDARKTIRSTTMIGFGAVALLAGLAALGGSGGAAAFAVALLGVALLVGGLIVRP